MFPARILAAWAGVSTEEPQVPVVGVEVTVGVLAAITVLVRVAEALGVEVGERAAVKVEVAVRRIVLVEVAVFVGVFVEGRVGVAVEVGVFGIRDDGLGAEGRAEVENSFVQAQGKRHKTANNDFIKSFFIR